MPKIPGVPHLRAVRALEKAGFKVVREGNLRFVTIPRNNPVLSFLSPSGWRATLQLVKEIRDNDQSGDRL